jgi:hypothetical protein
MDSDQAKQLDEPWFVQRRPAPADLVMEIARRAGVVLHEHVARDIAAKLLGWADTACEVRYQISREQWDTNRSQALAYVRDRLRRRLLDEVTAQGMIPVALPSEAIRYLAYPASLEGDRAGLEVPAGIPYERVEVVLAVACRTPAKLTTGGVQPPTPE